MKHVLQQHYPQYHDAALKSAIVKTDLRSNSTQTRRHWTKESVFRCVVQRR